MFIFYSMILDSFFLKVFRIPLMINQRWRWGEWDMVMNSQAANSSVDKLDTWSFRWKLRRERLTADCSH